MKRYIRAGVVAYEDEDLKSQWQFASVTSDTDFIRELVDGADSYQLLHFIAMNPNCPVDILSNFVNHKYMVSHYEDDILAYYWHILWGVAKNPNCPVDILYKLIGMTSDGTVISTVADNPNTPTDILEELADDSRENVREHVAANPNCPEDVLMKLSDDLWWILEAVMGNPNVSANVLKHIVESTEFPDMSMLAKQMLSDMEGA